MDTAKTAKLSHIMRLRMFSLFAININHSKYIIRRTKAHGQ